MNKPLHSMDSNIIEMKFPKLPKDYSFWLSHNKSQEDRISLEQSYGPYRKVRRHHQTLMWFDFIMTVSRREWTTSSLVMFKLGWDASKVKQQPSPWMRLMKICQTSSVFLTRHQYRPVAEHRAALKLSHLLCCATKLMNMMQVFFHYYLLLFLFSLLTFCSVLK